MSKNSGRNTMANFKIGPAASNRPLPDTTGVVMDVGISSRDMGSILNNHNPTSWAVSVSILRVATTYPYISPTYLLLLLIHCYLRNYRSLWGGISNSEIHNIVAVGFPKHNNIPTICNWACLPRLTLVGALEYYDRLT